MTMDRFDRCFATPLPEQSSSAVVPSLCRLSPSSQFRLTQRLSMSTDGEPTQQDTDDTGNCASSEVSSWGKVCEERNSSFMTSLMDICNRMIQPLTALQQTLDGDPSSADHDEDSGTVNAEVRTPTRSTRRPPLQPPRLPARSTRKAATTAPRMPPCRTCNCNRRCNFLRPCHHAVAGSLVRDPDLGRRATPNTVRQTNQNRPTERGVSDRRRCVCVNNANTTQNQKQGTRPPRQSQMSPTVTQSPTPQSHAGVTKDAADGCCCDEAPDDKPLMQFNDIHYWNQQEYHDFRCDPPASTALFDPMLNPLVHRHVVLMDSHDRLRKVIPGLRIPVYRPY